ncbi:MAG: cob(I)yrinic acid a,c-diamide adenosyltransferase [Bacteroidales bacterium]|nr:cob(I)yrinic acid a,c-diamide adenosyltransferase [Bacteroidales bacterium]
MVKIYTKGGDFGETSLLNGTRVSKGHDRVEAYGTLDELNAFIGLLRDHLKLERYRAPLLRIQENLFTAEALIAADPEKEVTGLPELTEEEILLLEKEIDLMTAELPLLKSFILPGGDPHVSRCHVARTVCRRAERAVIRLHKGSSVPPLLIRYLNRLSDYLFVLARILAKEFKSEEVTWPRKKQGKNLA